MTIAAAFAAHAKAADGRGLVGALADSRVTNVGDLSTGDEENKLLPLSENACAVGAGPRAPLLQAATLAREELATLRLFAVPERRRPPLWVQAGILFSHLQRVRASLQIERDSFALVGGFCRDGRPAVAEAQFGVHVLRLHLYLPRVGEVVSRTIGTLAAQPFLAEALRMGVAAGCRFDAAMSLLHDISEHPSQDFSSIGGRTRLRLCRAGERFSFDAYNLDETPNGSRGAGESESQSFLYDPCVFKDLDTRNQAGTLFTGGAPRASFLIAPPLILGLPTIFRGDEPPWVANDGPVPTVTAAGDIAVWGSHSQSTGLHPKEAEGIARYRAAATDASARQGVAHGRRNRKKR